MSFQNIVHEIESLEKLNHNQNILQNHIDKYTWRLNLVNKNHMTSTKLVAILYATSTIPGKSF